MDSLSWFVLAFILVIVFLIHEGVILMSLLNILAIASMVVLVVGIAIAICTETIWKDDFHHGG